MNSKCAAGNECLQVESVLVCDNATSVAAKDVPFGSERDVWWTEAIPQQSTDCPVVWMEAEEPLFLLYTSGSTGASCCQSVSITISSSVSQECMSTQVEVAGRSWWHMSNLKRLLPDSAGTPDGK